MTISTYRNSINQFHIKYAYTFTSKCNGTGQTICEIPVGPAGVSESSSIITVIGPSLADWCLG
jgi:hypothetical protein